VPRKTKAQLQRSREIADSTFLSEYDRDDKAIRDASKEIGIRPHLMGRARTVEILKKAGCTSQETEAWIATFEKEVA
jgi:hypothetical protein